jgi:hypothetical protein
VSAPGKRWQEAVSRQPTCWPLYIFVQALEQSVDELLAEMMNDKVFFGNDKFEPLDDDKLVSAKLIYFDPSVEKAF